VIPPLDPAAYRDVVHQALEEDVGRGDVTTASTVAATARARGVFVVKAACIVAGLEPAFEVFRTLDPSVEVRAAAHDGQACKAGDEIATVVGRARALLTGERTALNLLQRLSGIATSARRYVDAAAGRITILDTRKTTPLLRVLEKYAVRAGGATNHRAGLYDAILIKDNHVRLAGGVREAVTRARSASPTLPLEVEAQTLDEVDEAVAAGADTILLDNMTTAMIRDAVARVRHRARLEVSGGVTLERIPELALTGADFVSVGALTHSAQAVDISFEIEPLA